MPGKALFYPKRPEYRAFFPQKIAHDMIIPNSDNSRINYLRGNPGSLFAVVIYTIFKDRKSESYRKKPTRGLLIFQKIQRSKDQFEVPTNG
jgi:hypothetical protein